LQHFAKYFHQTLNWGGTIFTYWNFLILKILRANIDAFEPNVQVEKVRYRNQEANFKLAVYHRESNVCRCRCV